jgi:hypothetical protein
MTKFNLIRRLLTLITLILLHHVRFDWSSLSVPMLSLPLLGIDCLSFPLSGGTGPPSLPSSTLTPFPSDSRQPPASTYGTGIMVKIHVPIQSGPIFAISPDIFISLMKMKIPREKPAIGNKKSRWAYCPVLSVILASNSFLFTRIIDLKTQRKNLKIFRSFF